ncbi:uncharacterized protein TNCV_4320611 [Trichonephila clavipes]|nr:uncharacterized protein TNCV_4320611 [Trichonephila clavipes]
MSLFNVTRKCTIVKKEIKTNASSYDRYLAQNSNNEIYMPDFVPRHPVERNVEYINIGKSEVSKTPEGSKVSNTKELTRRPKSSIPKIAPKSTGAEKGCNKSKECQKSNNTVEISTTTHKFNHGNFKQIKRKSLCRSHDKSNSGSSVLHSSSLPSLVTQSSEIHSKESAEVAQINTIKANNLLISLKELSDDLECNRASDNTIDDSRHNLILHSTVKDFFTHSVTRGVLSKLCVEHGARSSFYKKKYTEINSDDDKFESFLKCSLYDLVNEYVFDIIHYLFQKFENLETKKISTNEILIYAYGKCNCNEVIYFTLFFCGGELLNLDTVISKLCSVGVLVMYDDFRKGK